MRMEICAFCDVNICSLFSRSFSTLRVLDYEGLLLMFRRGGGCAVSEGCKWKNLFGGMVIRFLGLRDYVYSNAECFLSAIAFCARDCRKLDFSRYF